MAQSWVSRRLVSAASEEPELWGNAGEEDAAALAAEAVRLEGTLHGNCAFRTLLEGPLSQPTMAQLFAGGVATAVFPAVIRYAGQVHTVLVWSAQSWFCSGKPMQHRHAHGSANGLDGPGAQFQGMVQRQASCNSQSHHLRCFLRCVSSMEICGA